MTRFAEGTEVTVEKSRMEIERLISRYKADKFAYGQDARRALIEFSLSDRRIRFILYYPSATEPRFTRAARNSYRNASASEQANRYDKEMRRLWRSLCLTLKAKLEAAQSGIETFEDAFMSHIVMPDGKTVGEHVGPQITQAYETGKMPPMLLGMGE